MGESARIAACAIVVLLGCRSGVPDVVGYSAPVVGTSSLAPALVGQSYSARVSGSGGERPLRWRIDSIPSGLEWLDIDPETGVLSGMPTALIIPGVRFEVRVTDKGGRAGSKTLLLAVQQCLDGQSAACHRDDGNACYAGKVVCTNGLLPACGASTPSTDAGHCGAGCGSCAPTGDACAGGVCGCGGGKSCGGFQICVASRCVDPRTWGAAELIQGDIVGGAPVETPRLALDPAGNALAVWSRSDGELDRIWSAHYAPGSGWDAAQLIDGDSTVDAYNPDVAFDPDGNALAVWTRRSGYANPWFNRREAGSSDWGKPGVLESNGEGDSGHPKVAFDSAGEAIAVWHQSDGRRQRIWSNRYVTGVGWGPPRGVGAADYPGGSRDPQLAIDSSDNALVVWTELNASWRDIWTNRYTAGEGWGYPKGMTSTVPGDAMDPRIAVDSSGNALAIWCQLDDARSDIWSSRYTAGLGWGTAELVEDDAGSACGPQIAIDPSGDALAVWHQEDGTRKDIRSNRYAAGTGWGTPQLVESDDSGDAITPVLAFDSSGTALALWAQSDGTRYDIWFNRYLPGVGWGAAQLVERDDAGDAFAPLVAFDRSGRALAVWHQLEDGHYELWSSSFE